MSTKSPAKSSSSVSTASGGRDSVRSRQSFQPPISKVGFSRLSKPQLPASPSKSDMSSLRKGPRSPESTRSRATTIVSSIVRADRSTSNLSRHSLVSRPESPTQSTRSSPAKSIKQALKMQKNRTNQTAASPTSSATESPGTSKTSPILETPLKESPPPRAVSPLFGFRQSSRKNAQALLKDDITVREGRFFHLRITLERLNGLEVSLPPRRTPTKSGGSTIGGSIGGDSVSLASTASFGPEIISAYAAILEDHNSSELRYTVSLPVDLDNDDLVVDWPTPSDGDEPSNTSKRRLYHSLVLHTDDDAEETNSKGDVEPVFAPGKVQIHLGLIKANQKLPLGVATLSVRGNELDDCKLVLEPEAMAPGVEQIIEKQQQRGFRFLGGKKKVKTIEVPKLGLSFPEDSRVFRLRHDARLSIQMDVMSGLFGATGPGLWGDLLDDEESCGPVPVVDVPDDGRGELTNRYHHEVIEVMDDKAGTTIISSPGSQYAQEMENDDNESQMTRSYFSIPVSTHVSRAPPVGSPRRIGNFTALCGDPVDVDDTELLGNTFSFASTLPEEEEEASTIGDPTATTFDQAHSYHRAMELASTGLDTRTEDVTAQTRTSETRRTDVSDPMNELTAAGESRTQSAGSHSSSNQTEIVSVGVSTLNSVRKAKDTLKHYADKLGVKVEDLLEAGIAESGTDGGSSTLGSDTYDASLSTGPTR